MWESCLIWIRRESENSPKKYVGGFWCKKTTLDEHFHWRKRYYVLWTSILARSENLKLKRLNDEFLKNMQLFTSQDVNWWTGVMWTTCGLLWCFYQLFGLSFWRHPFTAEDQLVSKWCNAKFLQICSDEETNSSTSWMAWRWVNFQQMLIFGWTIPLMLLFSARC